MHNPTCLFINTVRDFTESVREMTPGIDELPAPSSQHPRASVMDVSGRV